MSDDNLDTDALASADLSTVSPDQFAALVRNASADELAALMSRPDARSKVLDEVFSRMGAQYKGGRDVDAAIHWRILDRPDGSHDLYETVLSGGTCTLNTAPEREPTVTISLTGPEFLKLASGTSAPTVMFMTGRLRLAGDVGFASGLARLFDIPHG